MANNENGKLIVNILQSIGEPVTFAKIMSLVKGAAGEPRREVKECVEDTLEAGIRYGFLHRKNRKYYAAPVKKKAPESEDERPKLKKSRKRPRPDGEDEESEPENPETEVTDMEDRGRRRRSSRSRSRRRRSRRRG